MQYFEHLIKNRTCLVWPLSQEQQQLAAVEIESAACTIRRWRLGNGDDYTANNAEAADIRKRKSAAARQLLSREPVTICIVHDSEYEIDKSGMRRKLRDSFRLLREAAQDRTGRYRTHDCAVCYFGIWLVLVVPGEDKFVAATCDTYDLTEKPSAAIPNSIDSGNGGLGFWGNARDVKEAMKVLRDEDYFPKRCTSSSEW